MRKALYLAIFLANSSVLLAQHTTYSITEVSNGTTTKRYRSGSKVRVEKPDQVELVEVSGDKEKGYSWDPTKDTTACATVSGTFDDPFEIAALMTKLFTDLTQTGTDTVIGREAKVMEGTTPEGKAKLWIDSETGLVLKMTGTPKTGETITVMEVKEFSLDEPDEELFKMPATCAAK